MRGGFVAGDLATMQRAARIVSAALGEPDLPLIEIEHPADAAEVPPRCLPVLQVIAPQTPPPFGAIDAAAGRAAGDCVVWAARTALRGEIAAMVTAPLHKLALAAAGAPYAVFPGHTELLQSEAARHAGVEAAQMPVRMMLMNARLRVVLLSIHVALREALAAVTADNIVQTLNIARISLQKMLGREPTIAVAGLNPHAGEGGRFGDEEIAVIAPAIATAQQGGVQAMGPFAPDTVFMRAAAGEFDAVLALYHDQGLIAIKSGGIDEGVNVTLGLPLIRTSPDHGTAFDLAGTGKASAKSLLAAMRAAQRMTTQ